MMSPSVLVDKGVRLQDRRRQDISAKGTDMRIGQTEKRHIFRLFASGKNPIQVSQISEDPHQQDLDIHIDLSRAERLYEEYLELPMGEKLRLTLAAEYVSNRSHRLLDDIRDLSRVDAVFDTADEKLLVSLLDIKRKIKERMAKEWDPQAETGSGLEDGVTDDEINEHYEIVFGRPPPQKKMR